MAGSVLLAILLAVSCKPTPGARETIQPAPVNPPAARPQPPRLASFKTPYQIEAQFIVQAIATDLAEQLYFAARHRAPTASDLAVESAVEGTPEAQEFELRLNLEGKNLVYKIAATGPIFSPGIYAGFGASLADALGLHPRGDASDPGDTSLLQDLLDGTALTIERANQAVSGNLEQHFTDPRLHEEAALVLGAFLLRDHSGKFFDIRSPLSRLTAHLAVARFLESSQILGLNGQVAEAILLTLIGNQTQALEKIQTIDPADASVARMIRALQAINTGDYRALDKVRDRSPVESLAWFTAMADYANCTTAWQRLKKEQKVTVDFVRATDAESYSVEIGHQLLRAALPLEIQEEERVYELYFGRKLVKRELLRALNQVPERCFSIDDTGEAHVRVIGWGQWANFFQRHLCHAVQQNFQFMNSAWCVPEQAKKFANGCDRLFDGLYLYPFVRRFTCTDGPGYRQAEEEGIQAASKIPQLIPAECWNALCARVDFAPLYSPSPYGQLTLWFLYSPLPGTAYDIGPRLRQGSWTQRPDAVTRLEQLHTLAPYDNRISHYLIWKKFNNQPTHDQAAAIYKDVLPWSVYAVRTVAQTVTNDPIQFEKLLLDAAPWDPTVYYDLGDYFERSQQEEKAARYIDQACDNDGDSVRVANRAESRVRHYLKLGQWNKAAGIADAAAEVYSARGLQAKAVFMEATSNYDEAFQWYSKINERYNDSKPLALFCERYKQQTGDSRFDAPLAGLLKNSPPAGQEKVSLNKYYGVVAQPPVQRPGADADTYQR